MDHLLSRRMTLFAAVAAFAVVACAEIRVVPPGGDDDEDETREISRESTPDIEFTAGGDEARTRNYRARINIGSPVPVRQTESDNYRVTFSTGPAIEASEIEDHD